MANYKCNKCGQTFRSEKKHERHVSKDNCAKQNTLKELMTE